MGTCSRDCERPLRTLDVGHVQDLALGEVGGTRNEEHCSYDIQDGHQLLVPDSVAQSLSRGKWTITPVAGVAQFASIPVLENLIFFR